MSCDSRACREREGMRGERRRKKEREGEKL